MTATLGRIGEYEPQKEDWTSYVERLGHFFHANGIDDDDKKRLVLLSVIGPVMVKMDPPKLVQPGTNSSINKDPPVCTSSC